VYNFILLIFLWATVNAVLSLVAPAICYLFFLHVVLYVFSQINDDDDDIRTALMKQYKVLNVMVAGLCR